MFNPIAAARRIFRLSKDVDLLATLKWNYKLFPFSVARKIPLFIGYNVDITGYSANKANGGYFIEYQHYT